MTFDDKKTKRGTRWSMSPSITKRLGKSDKGRHREVWGFTPDPTPESGVFDKIYELLENSDSLSMDDSLDREKLCKKLTTLFMKLNSENPKK